MSNPSARSWYHLSSILRPPQPLSTPLRPPPKEVQEAKPNPVTSSRSIKHEQLKPRHEPPKPRHEPPKPRHEPPKPRHEPPKPRHEPPKPRHEQERIHQRNMHTSSEKTNLIHGPNKEHYQQQQQEFGDVIMGTQCGITISGENKGAVMEILRSGTGKGRQIQSSSEGEEKKSKSMYNSKKHSDIPMDGFVNSNVQMVNDSIVYNLTETIRDPGIHLSIYRKPSSGNGFIIWDHGNGYNSSLN